MKQRIFLFAGQILLVLVGLVIAREVTTWMWLVPGELRKQSPIDAGTLSTIAVYFLVAHFTILGALQLLNRAHPLSTFRRFTIEVYGALIATSLAASAVFLFTAVPFSANFFAWFYVLLGIGYLLLFGASRLFALAPENYGPADGPPARSFVSLVVSPWTVMMIVLVSTPGLLAVLYKVDGDFSNAVNDLRAELNISTSADWALVPAYPGHRFEQPMYLAFEPGRDDSFMMLSRPGRLLRYVTAPEWQEEVLLDLSAEVRSIDMEMGAYSFALHPEFNQSGSDKAGFAYLYYTHVDDGRQFNRLVRFDLSEPTRESREASRLVLMDLERPTSGMHNGGGLLFGPDGFLYLSIGDYNAAEETQRIDSMLIAGIFRIDVDMQGGDISAPIKRQPKDGKTQNYYIPTDNPWFGEENALEEYWALGFRNPWRMSMDPETGSIWLGDVGRNLFEEYNRVEKGDNGQWSFREGPVDTEYAKLQPVIGREIPPIYYYEQTALSRAATGGLVYRDDRHEGLRGLYIFADNQAGTLHALDPDDPVDSAQVIAKGNQFGQLGITSILTDPAGEIYVTLLGGKEQASGEILRLVPADEELPAEPDDALLVASATEDHVDSKYTSVCSRCHGLDGRGAPEAELGKERPDFTSPTWQERVTDDYLRKVILDGGSAVGKSEEMPAWRDFFDEEELDLLVAKLRDFED